MIVFAVVFVAAFAMSVKMYSSSKSVKPSNYYCFYDNDRAICSEDAEGWACYGVNADCSWME